MYIYACSGISKDRYKAQVFYCNINVANFSISINILQEKEVQEPVKLDQYKNL